ncbi:MAG: ribonuclease PH, partial [Candidatus Omnitrophica bacterium]|nr:ribonuclease PH [Candidatus Omnitrophota bacterium]
MRKAGRKSDSLRKINIKKGFIEYAEGSCLFETGHTKVICTASVEESVPPFMRGKGRGWVTAEYSMLPRSCQTRMPRESSRGKKAGRTYEIQRLIGRSLRSVTDLDSLGERTIWLDCDVIQADGGTRCASITGSFIAMCLALDNIREKGLLKAMPIREFLAAVSVGISGGQAFLDLDYSEDSRADVDMNVVMTSTGKFVEIQG